MITDAMIEACGFRMFELHEIAATMVMLDHPRGGLYVMRGGNKRVNMSLYGNAVTPPVTRLQLERLFAVLGGGTFTDLFCGAGGSSIGAELAGGELRLGLNHFRPAIETHAENFPHADHDCADVSALTTGQIRRYPDSDILLASPECTNHSLAKGARRRKPQASSLFEDGPAGDDEQDRSRATMWDVVRFAEQKILKGKPYKAIVVENVVDAFRWGADDDGGLFAAWRLALTNLGYASEVMWLNSMFCPPTPQSRDRMYVVFWRKGIKRPDLRVEPPSWCPFCEKVVEGRQTWKRPDRPVETAKGKPVGARYGQQYFYSCPDCHGVVLPGACPASTAIDWQLVAPLIGDRARPLAVNTYERIRRGLEKVLGEPFAIRLLQGGRPRPLTLPLVTLTSRHDMAVVLPVAGNTFERTPGNRARRADLQPVDTVHAGAQRVSNPIPFGLVVPLVMAYSENGVPRVADLEPVQTQRTNPTLAMVYANRAHGVGRDAHAAPAQTLCGGGGHLALVMRNNTARGDQGQMSTPVREPFRTLTAACHQSLVVPYQSEPHGVEEPARTVTTRDRLALLIPPSTGANARDPHTDPATTLTTETRCALVEVPQA